MVSARPNRDIASGDEARLRILAITDLHARLLDFDYDKDRPAPATGLVSLADRIAEARAEAPNTLLFDNGDTFQGNALGDMLMAEARVAGVTPRTDAARVAEDVAHPLLSALAALGVDAAVPGNHDFNFGIEMLQELAGQAQYPFVLTNLVARRGADPGDDCPLLPLSHVLERAITDEQGVRHVLKVGLLGVVPPQVMRWDADHLTGRAETRPAPEAVAFWAQDLRRRGADIVVALCHGGLGQTDPQPGGEDVARAVARIAGVDAVVAGHRHHAETEEAEAAAAPIVAPGCYGSHLGQIDLHLVRKSETGAWSIAASATALHPARATLGAEGKRIARIAAPAHARARTRMTEAIGVTETPMHSFFAGALPAAATGLIAEVQGAAIREALRDSRHRDLPILSAATLFKTGGPEDCNAYTHIPAGPVLRRHMHDLYPYPNTLTALRTNGTGIGAWLEHAARIYAGCAPGNQMTGRLFEKDAARHDFDMVHGVSFRIDLTQPEGKRIRDLRLANGRALKPDQPVVLATTNYRASGSGGYPVAEVIHRSPRLVRDLIAEHVATRGIVAPRPGVAWRLSGPAGARLRFETTPEARPYLRGTPLRAVSDCCCSRLCLTLQL
ncbi:2',3'-cyclic-nucleotide 2'-phosphodiesterase / 3'-nucleotidase [Roseivivax lentus]|uniref:2',3'-cyclic-nucleotide 2'-phosphodiesterase / 3'-nucleotidase n=1 Tax=Roseivivax lentus TaxID=633194 RepID=A0A1N7M784_9RHOB|nr:5'-nucleotidase C-terminal domain-containing protein [Roseivivax lentus]SIS81940.1 2',3'-cyclic-nucleotide 2'-phosphodiesterase / 3'-nucleotidase [Roseivivax lentus]